MRENRPYGSEGGEGRHPSRPLSADGACDARVPGAVQHAAKSAFTRVFDALWRRGAPQTRDPGSGVGQEARQPGSRICAAASEGDAAARAGHG